MKIFLGRQSLLGDIVTYLPVLDLIEDKYPNSYKVFSLAKKCSQILPLLANYPLIDRIQISEPSEGFGKADNAVIESCDLYIEVNPQHKQDDWYNYRHMIEENFHMIDLDYNKLSYQRRIPKLVKWFDSNPQKRYIAFWPCAGYSGVNKRNPSREWYNNLIEKILEMIPGSTLIQFGSSADYTFNDFYCDRFIDMREQSFFGQIKMTHNCGCMIGTDSGSSLIMAAYGFPQIALITNHNLNHTQNFLALAPRNPNCLNIFSHGGFSNLNQETVIDSIKLLY